MSARRGRAGTANKENEDDKRKLEAITKSIEELSKTVDEIAKRQLTEKTVMGWVQSAIEKSKPPEAPVHPMSNGGYVDLQRLEACTTARTSLEMWVLFVSS